MWKSTRTKEPSCQWENAEDGSLKIDNWSFTFGVSGQDPNVISIVNSKNEYLTVDFTISTTEDKSSHCSKWSIEPSGKNGPCVIYDHEFKIALHLNKAGITLLPIPYLWKIDQGSKTIVDAENQKLSYDVTNKTVILSNSAQDKSIPFVRTKNKQKLPTKKHFLYEIVANKYNEIDVDKWDYFTRDCHSLGLKHGFDQTRLLNSARVMKRKKADLPWEVKDYHIAYRDAAKQDLIGMFYTRAQLHKRACQHKVSYAVEMMDKRCFNSS